jgi:hypothetical protein
VKGWGGKEAEGKTGEVHAVFATKERANKSAESKEEGRECKNQEKGKEWSA